MYTITLSRAIPAPVHTLFGLLLPDRLSTWYRREDALTVDVIDAGPPGPGQRLRLHSRRERLTVEITAFTPPTRLGWRSIEGRPSSLIFFLLAAGDVTHVQVSETFVARNLFGRLFPGFMRKIMVDALRADLDALADLAVAPPISPAPAPP